MKTIQFLTKYLSSPIMAHRDLALLSLFNEAKSNPQVIKQLGLNLTSVNFDVVLNSLRILQALSFRNSRKVKPLLKKIAILMNNATHFGIINLCINILGNLEKVKATEELILKKVTPKINGTKSTEWFSDNCEHSLEYILGGKKYKYELSHICRAFRYDCKKASKQVFKIMKILGYKKGMKYWKERPQRWRNDFEGNYYETRIQYFARHAIQIFLLWCINNLSISREMWEDLRNYERNWDASIPSLLVQEKPDLIKFTDFNVQTDVWLKSRIKKEDAYELLLPNCEWIPLYENTKLRYDDKSFDRYVTTCFIRMPLKGLSKKIEFSPVHYTCSNCYINELPIEAKKAGLLSNDSHVGNDFLENKLIPSYGIVSKNFDNYVKVFPAPEIVEYFKLKQKKNSLEYYKGNELIINCINWKSGYYRNIGNRAEEKFELANHGQLLMIKTKYLKKYLKENDIELIAVGSIWKRKNDNWGGGYERMEKYSKYKWFPFEIVKL
ncbi:MAG: hypothetical protein WAT71_07660 [Ignavibacteria bacterium]